MQTQISNSVFTYFDDSELELLIKLIKNLVEDKKEKIVSVRFFIISDSLYCELLTTKNLDEDCFFGILYSKSFLFSLQNVSIFSTQLSINRLSERPIDLVRKFLESQ